MFVVFVASLKGFVYLHPDERNILVLLVSGRSVSLSRAAIVFSIPAEEWQLTSITLAQMINYITSMILLPGAFLWIFRALYYSNLSFFSSRNLSQHYFISCVLKIILFVGAWYHITLVEFGNLSFPWFGHCFVTSALKWLYFRSICPIYWRVLMPWHIYLKYFTSCSLHRYQSVIF